MPPSIFQLITISILLSSRLASAQTPSSSLPSSSPLGSSSLGSSSLVQTLPTPSVSLLSTNPTAVPLSQIVSNEPSSPTPTLASTPASGATPTFIPGAPGLPSRKYSNRMRLIPFLTQTLQSHPLVLLITPSLTLSPPPTAHRSNNGLPRSNQPAFQFQAFLPLNLEDAPTILRLPQTVLVVGGPVVDAFVQLMSPTAPQKTPGVLPTTMVPPTTPPTS